MFTIEKHVENKSMHFHTTKTTTEYERSDQIKLVGCHNRFKLEN